MARLTLKQRTWQIMILFYVITTACIVLCAAMLYLLDLTGLFIGIGITVFFIGIWYCEGPKNCTFLENVLWSIAAVAGCKTGVFLAIPTWDLLHSIFLLH
jgi:hypothetical protein